MVFYLGMKAFFVFTILSMCVPAWSVDCVVLLHGLARTKSSLNKIQEELNKNNKYKVVNESYPSRSHDIQTLSTDFLPPIIKKCGDYKKLHFVTHSLGGILVRYYFSKNNPKSFNEGFRLGRVVMLAPPNHGSEVVDMLKDQKVFEMWNGPAGLELGTDSGSVPNSLEEPDFDFGVIAGKKSYNPLFSSWIPDEDDGKVSVKSTKLKSQSDHLLVDENHTFIMNSDEVISQVKHFLENGEFNH